MKTPRRRWMFLAIAVMAALFSAQPSSRQRSNLQCLDGSCDKEHCTVVMVGKKASADGSVISTHTSDCGVCDWTWRYVPPADHQPGEMRKIYYFDQFATDPPKKGLRYDALEEKYAGLEIPQVSHTYGYLHGMFGYMNDNQVALG